MLLQLKRELLLPEAGTAVHISKETWIQARESTNLDSARNGDERRRSLHEVTFVGLEQERSEVTGVPADTSACETARRAINFGSEAV